MRRLAALRRGEIVGTRSDIIICDAIETPEPPQATHADIEAIIAGLRSMAVELRYNEPTTQKPKKKKHRVKDEVVYVVVHPCWPEYVKIGHTSNIDARLISYNTGDPLRRYTYAHTQDVYDRILAERGIHELLASYRRTGTEWFRIHVEDAISVIRSLHSGTYVEV
jgi:hypothetical protein